MPRYEKDDLSLSWLQVYWGIEGREIVWGTVPIGNNLWKMLINAVFWRYSEIGRFL